MSTVFVSFAVFCEDEGEEKKNRRAPNKTNKKLQGGQGYVARTERGQNPSSNIERRES